MRVSAENLKAIAQSGSATAMQNALMNAASYLQTVEQALITEQELTEEWSWLKAHPDELMSAVDDAYGRPGSGWDGEDPAVFAERLADEIKHQRGKVASSASRGEKL